MGRNAEEIQRSLRDRLADLLPRFDWETESRVGTTPVDVAGRGDGTLVVVEVEWRRADPADNTAKLFRQLARGESDVDRTVICHLFTEYYALAGGGVSTKRENAEFVGRRAARTVDRLTYLPTTLPLDPPKGDGRLPDGWADAVERAAGEIAATVDDGPATEATADSPGQRTVADFLARHDLSTHPTYHALDLAAETGEIAAALNETTDYGATPDAAAVPRDELGDALFALLALCESLDVDARTALAESLDKYEARIAETGAPDSAE